MKFAKKIGNCRKSADITKENRKLDKETSRQNEKDFTCFTDAKFTDRVI